MVVRGEFVLPVAAIELTATVCESVVSRVTGTAPGSSFRVPRPFRPVARPRFHPTFRPLFSAPSTRSRVVIDTTRHDFHDFRGLARTARESGPVYRTRGQIKRARKGAPRRVHDPCASAFAFRVSRGASFVSRARGGGVAKIKRKGGNA